MTAESFPRRLIGLARTLHIYLTMLGCFLLFFFSLTGFMLNHAEGFGLEQTRTRSSEGRLSRGMLEPVDKLAVVECLRSEYGMQGALDSFDSDGDEYRLVFKRPGSRSEAVIDRKTGHLGLSTECRGMTSIWTDLHKGASSGSGWKLVIDATSIFLFLASLTGIVLWVSLPRRRRIGVTALIGGVVLSLLAYWCLVP
jgi:hypothetical protein